MSAARLVRGRLLSFVEVRDRLLVPVLKDVEAFPVEAMNSAATISHHNVHQHNFGRGMQHRNRGI